jgi:transcriptional regulator with XRE-family HTH domain
VGFLSDLKKIRIQQGINVYKMAKAIGAPYSNVKRMESGANVTLDTLGAYMDVLGIDLHKILIAE